MLVCTIPQGLECVYTMYIHLYMICASLLLYLITDYLMEYIHDLLILDLRIRPGQGSYYYKMAYL